MVEETHISQSMRALYYGANSWLLELANLRILVDPWLVGSLTFGGQRWLFEGRHRHPFAIPDNLDLLLLSQGLPDHTHLPTLERLPRSLPVIASPTAAQRVQKLGFTTITTLQPGETTTVGQLEIRATAGAPVPQIENGYLLRDQANGQSLYYEPHGYVDPALQTLGPLTVALTPVVTLELPLSLPIIQGQASALALVEQLKPLVLLPTAAGGDVEYSGVLMSLIKERGSVADFIAQLQQRHLPTQVIEASPGQAVDLSVALTSV
jgi:L-ascorbate metabolism protein UlaG (beta-lactamase superfamily)